MKNKIVSAFIILFLISGFAVVVKNSFLYVMCIMLLGGTVLLGLIALVTGFVLRLLPLKLQSVFGDKKTRISIVLFFCVLFFLFVDILIDVRCLRNAPGAISFVSDIARIVFSAFLAWCLIYPIKPKRILGGAAAFVMFIATLSFINTTALKTGMVVAPETFDSLATLGYVRWVNTGDDIDKR